MASNGVSAGSRKNNAAAPVNRPRVVTADTHLLDGVDIIHDYRVHDRARKPAHAHAHMHTRSTKEVGEETPMSRKVGRNGLMEVA